LQLFVPAPGGIFNSTERVSTEAALACTKAARILAQKGERYPLQTQGVQLQLPDSQEQDPPHWQPVASTLLCLRFFGCSLRFDFIVINF
jgi:hypothetical protein